ncbi:hypothetical protein D3C73_1316200 [compost metagenome]
METRQRHWNRRSWPGTAAHAVRWSLSVTRWAERVPRTLLEHSQRGSDINFSQAGKAFGSDHRIEGSTFDPGLTVRYQGRHLVGHVAGGDTRLIGNPTLGAFAAEDPTMLLKPGEQFGRRDVQLLGGVRDTDRPARRSQAFDGRNFWRLIENDQTQ